MSNGSRSPNEESGSPSPSFGSGDASRSVRAAGGGLEIGRGCARTAGLGWYLDEDEDVRRSEDASENEDVGVVDVN